MKSNLVMRSRPTPPGSDRKKKLGGKKQWGLGGKKSHLKNSHVGSLDQNGQSKTPLRVFGKTSLRVFRRNISLNISRNG